MAECPDCGGRGERKKSERHHLRRKVSFKCEDCGHWWSKFV